MNILLKYIVVLKTWFADFKWVCCLLYVFNVDKLLCLSICKHGLTRTVLCKSNCITFNFDNIYIVFTWFRFHTLLPNMIAYNNHLNIIIDAGDKKSSTKWSGKSWGRKVCHEQSPWKSVVNYLSWNKHWSLKPLFICSISLHILQAAD